MSYLKVFFLSFLMVLLCASPVYAKGKAKIKLKKSTIELGPWLHEDAKKTIKLKLTNAGNEELVIENVASSCDCVRTSFDPKPCAPGQQTEIIMHIDLLHTAADNIEKEVRIYSNAQNEELVLKLKIKLVD